MQFEKGGAMSNARFSVLQARAVKDRRISDAQFRTLAALGMYADEDGWCFPRLSTLGNDLRKSKQAVGRDTIALKKLGYLEVKPRFNEDGSRRSNLYRLKFDPPPVNMDDSTPSTSEVDTPSTSEVDVNVPYNTPKKSSKKTDETKGTYKVPGIEAAILQDRPVEESDLPTWEAREKAACDAFEAAFGIDRPWNWYPAKSTQEKEWAELRAYLVQLYEADKSCFIGYATWANDKYSRGAKNASQIRQDPGAFPTAWASYKASEMYSNKTEKSESRTSLLRTL